MERGEGEGRQFSRDISMNVILISTGKRIMSLQQSVTSLLLNAVNRPSHHLTVVFDLPDGESIPSLYDRVLIVLEQQGASAARNIGASSIPKYRRQSHVMFIDDDVYMCPRWDEKLKSALSVYDNSVVSGHAHPFNLPTGSMRYQGSPVQSAGVLSTVNMCMPWEIWDDVGWFVEPGGAGGSEDVEWCGRATKKGYGLLVTEPQCVIHTGLTSSNGKQIIGYDLMVEQNKRLVEHYRLEGKVVVR